MGSAKSSTVFPRWAIGLIVGAGVLLLLVAAIIIVRCCNKDGDNKFGNKLKVKPSKPEQTATPIVEEKKPLFERILIQVPQQCNDNTLLKYSKRSLLEKMQDIIRKDISCNLSYFLFGIFRGIDVCNFTSDDINVGVVDATLSDEDDTSQEIKEKIASELNKFVGIIKDDRSDVNRDVTKEVLDCADKINALEPKATDDIQTSK